MIYAVCHSDRKHYARGLCRACWFREYRKRPGVAEKRRAERVEYMKRPKVRARKNAYWRNRYATDAAYRERCTRSSLARQGSRRGFPAGVEAAFAEKQKGLCAICRRVMQGRNGPHAQHRDHDHATGRARGLLCGACNLALGLYEKHQRPAGLRVTRYDRYLRGSS